MLATARTAHPAAAATGAAAQRSPRPGLRARLQVLPRDARDTLFLLLVIGWLILPQVTNLPPWCSAIAGVVLLWRASLAVTARPLPSAWWILALLLAAVAATFVTHRTLLGRDAGVSLIVVLLAL